MQFAEEFTARRLNAHAEVARAREIELLRVIAERKALAKESRVAARRARRVGVVSAPIASVAPDAPAESLSETVTVEAILRSAPAAGVGAPTSDEPASLVGSGTRRELHASVR